MIDVNAFNELNNLRRVDLFNNICINEDFNTPDKVHQLSREVASKCSSDNRIENCVCDVASPPVATSSGHEGSLSEISCEVIRTISGEASFKECLMTRTTEINSPGFTITTSIDENVRTISFANNKKIQFLPENVHDAFPDLKVFDAAACAVRKISGKNFRKLSKLSTIFLDGNLIERVDGDTFHGLTSLTNIYLSELKNQISKPMETFFI